ncbi:hypothetical protein JXA56_00735 [Candidatus Micrarchaeota archaeon]|nr:hypothetical protein [Candidatus Micrarchaeota archaeon]
MKEIIILLLLLAPAFAVDCSGKTVEFDLRVLDAKFRPIQNAEVWIRYDPGTSFGEKYFTTVPRLTDENGKVHYLIRNQGTTVREIDCTIWAYARVEGINQSISVKALEHGPIIDIQFREVYPINFYVKDQYNAGLSNASVTIGDKLKKTDKNGYAKFHFPKGSHSYLANFEAAKKSGTIVVDEDVDFTVIFPYSNIQVETKDDRGDHIPATITILGETITLHNGIYYSERAYGEYIEYEVVYRGIVKSGMLVPAENAKIEVIYDVHAPTFGEIFAEVVNNRTRLNIQVTDEGIFASGIEVTSMRVNYRLEPADATTPWDSATVFATGFNSFAVEFPQLPPNSIVQFRADVKDRAENRATIDGKFSTLTVRDPDTQNQTDTQKTEPEDQGMPLFYIISGGFIAILAIYLVFRIKSKA